MSSESQYDVRVSGLDPDHTASWTEMVDRRDSPKHCPACNAKGELEKTLAPGQLRCPTPVDRCTVTTFMEGPRDAE